jgi:hypothetical protein
MVLISHTTSCNSMGLLGMRTFSGRKPGRRSMLRGKSWGFIVCLSRPSSATWQTAVVQYNRRTDAGTLVATDRPVVIPDSLAAKTGLTKDHVRIKEKYGGGYPVLVEGMHQLHCLVSSGCVDLSNSVNRETVLLPTDISYHR